MRLVHLADLHLGFRQFDRLTVAGVNQREADVADTFRVAVDRIIALAPDAIVIGGDVVHSPRPSNNTIVTLFSEFSRLTAALPNAVVVVAAGNHDLARVRDANPILRLLSALGVHLADYDARRFWFPDRDLSVLAVPDAPGLVRPALEPDPRARFNVLVLHGEVQGMLPTGRDTGERAAMEITHDELQAAAWDYVALGHWHMHREIAPNAWYSGSIDYTSSNPWQEIATPKGFIEHDLATGTHTFHALPPSRVYVDLPAIDALELTAAQLNAAIDAAVEGYQGHDGIDGGIDNAVVRLVVRNVSRELDHELERTAIRTYKRRALSFNLDLRRPERVARAPIAATYAELRQRSLPDILRERFGTRELAAGVDRDELTTRALHYLELATDRDGGPVPAAAASPAVTGERVA